MEQKSLWWVLAESPHSVICEVTWVWHSCKTAGFQIRQLWSLFRVALMWLRPAAHCAGPRAAWIGWYFSQSWLLHEPGLGYLKGTVMRTRAGCCLYHCWNHLGRGAVQADDDCYCGKVGSTFGSSTIRKAYLLKDLGQMSVGSCLPFEWGCDRAGVALTVGGES